MENMRLYFNQLKACRDETKASSLLLAICREAISSGDLNIARLAIDLFDTNFAKAYEIEGCVVIPLTQGQKAIIDKEDWPRVSQHKWFACKDNHSRPGSFYARAKIHGRSVSLHRFIMDPLGTNQKIVDHEDQDGLNCRRYNLRFVSRSQSAMNRRGWYKRNTKGAKSSYKGVYARVTRDGRVTGWRSVIKANKQIYNLGTFATEEEAALAYDKKAVELHGDYAVLNFSQLSNPEGSDGETNTTRLSSC